MLSVSSHHDSTSAVDCLQVFSSLGESCFQTELVSGAFQRNLKQRQKVCRNTGHQQLYKTVITVIYYNEP